MGIIYRITRLSDGRCYVGMTTNSLGKRWANHLSNSKKRHGPLSRAIDDDDRMGYAIDLLEDGIPNHLLEEREKHWIAKLGTKVPHGFNGNAGGATGPRGYRSDGLLSRIVSDRHGVSRGTANRWIRQGRDLMAPTSWQCHGAYKTKAWVKWHDMKDRGGLCAEWQRFEVFASWFEAWIIPGRQMRRIDKMRPWAPDNCYMPEPCKA